MKERLQHHLSDVGESFDYLRSDIRNLSRYMAALEELIEGYRTPIKRSCSQHSPSQPFVKARADHCRLSHTSGRGARLYCSARCRMRAHRWRHDGNHG